jgi:hypothetical protein
MALSSGVAIFGAAFMPPSFSDRFAGVDRGASRVRRRYVFRLAGR